MKRFILITIAALMAVAILTGTGCRRVPVERDGSARSAGSQTRSADVSVDREGAERVRVTLTMGVGELRVGALDAGAAVATDTAAATGTVASTGTAGGALVDDAVARGTLLHPSTWPTSVDYTVDGTQGVLAITQMSGKGIPFGDADNRWDVDFSRGLPLEMNVELGAGDSELRMGELDLEDLEVTTGAGQTELFLTGARTRDLTVSIAHGVGELTVWLPSDIGVRVRGAGDGVGDLNADGFTRSGDDLVNSAWNGPGPRIDVRIERGVGDVNLRLK